MSKEVKLKAAQDYAKSRGGLCLSTEYLNNKEKLEWKCSNPDHPSWFANTDNVFRKNTWCLACSGKQKKSSDVGLKEAYNYAQIHQGQCLSIEYLSDEKNLEWKCSNPDHPSWFASSDNVLRKKTWCKHCADELQKNKKDSDGLLKSQEYAISRGGMCLSKEYINQNTNLEWKCHNPEHLPWFAFPKIRLTNSWCKQCYNERRKIG